MIHAATYPLRFARRLLSFAFPVSVYIMWEVRPLLSFGFHRFKVGISSEPKNRLRQIRAELGADVRLFTSLPIPFALRFEQGFLHATRRIKCEMPQHSGASEWRMWANVFCGILTLLAWWAFGFQNTLWVFLIVVFVPLPLDAFLTGLLLAVFWYSLFAAGLFAAGWFIFKIA